MADQLHIGDTVDYQSAAGSWTGEILDTYTNTALVRPLAPSHKLSDSYELPLADLIRVGDPDAMRDDGCDDVDVTGRVRPMHRHATTGRAHAHPGGATPHAHQSPETAAAMSNAVTQALASDPVERLAQAMCDHRMRLITVGPQVGAEDRAAARRALASLTAEPWHLVTFEHALAGEVPEIDQEWRP